MKNAKGEDTMRPTEAVYGLFNGGNLSTRGRENIRIESQDPNAGLVIHRICMKIMKVRNVLIEFTQLDSRKVSDIYTQKVITIFST